MGSEPSQVPHGGELVELAESMVTGGTGRIAAAREAVSRAMGHEAMVDAVGVAANFQRMVRIADATGIPLGDTLAQATAAVREEFDLDRLRKA